MEPSYEPIYLRYGGAKKAFSEISPEEFEEVAQSIVRRAKEKAFSKGRPIIVSRNGRLLQEWSDGRIVDITDQAHLD